jgi:hypothetical protein
MLWKLFFNLHFPVPSMNRLNQTEPATFSILLCWAFFRDSIFIYFEVIATLTFDLVTQTSIEVFYPVWAIILWSLNTVGHTELKLCSGNCFQFKSNSVLDLWLCDPKINSGLLPTMDNRPMKFKYCGLQGTWVMLWKLFSVLK